MRVLVGTLGSHGDVLPFLALGQAIRARGHEVHFYADAYFGPHAREAGLAFSPMAAPGEYERLLHSTGQLDIRHAMTLLADYTSARTPEVYEAMRRDVVPGSTLLVGSSLMFAPRLLQETHGLPMASVHLAPSVMRSVHAAPRLSAFDLLGRLPRPLKRLAWSLADRLLLDPLFAVPLNRFRDSLGLPPVSKVLDAWLHSPDLSVGFFPDWFGPPQPDWPRPLALTGFPLTDFGHGAPLPAEVNAFMAAGEPPIGFTAGTATAAMPGFFAASAEACAISGRRGILLTQFAGQLPPALPPGVVHFGYVPFAALLPRLAAFVHHGGIGSTSQALRAGVPQLIRPMAFDQFDNARRVTDLGVGEELLPTAYNARSAASALVRMTGDAALQARCRQVSGRVGGSAVDATCELILARLGPRLPALQATEGPQAAESSSG